MVFGVDCWKLTKITGTPLILEENATRVIYYDVLEKKFHGCETMIKENNKYYITTTYAYSQRNKGLIKVVNKSEINFNLKYDWKSTFRGLILFNKINKEIVKEEQKF